MPELWDADIQITEDQAMRLITKQFPNLAPVRLTPLGIGWDNVAYRVNETWVFRFPRRLIATELLQNEVRVLPLLAPRLPLPIPSACFIGVPTEGYPHVFVGYSYLDGRTACQRNWTDEARARLAPALARFLSALHRLPLDAESRAIVPKDTLNRADCARRVESVVTRLHKNAALLTESGLDAALLADAARDAASAPPFAGPPTWVHGDLYPRHLLVGADGVLSGVIDWGDVHQGDPALDLSIAFTFLPPSVRATFRDTYGDITPATWQRARFRALHYGAILVDYGTSIKDAALVTVGQDALRFACRE